MKSIIHQDALRNIYVSQEVKEKKEKAAHHQEFNPTVRIKSSGGQCSTSNIKSDETCKLPARNHF